MVKNYIANQIIPFKTKLMGVHSPLIILGLIAFLITLEARSADSLNQEWYCAHGHIHTMSALAAKNAGNPEFRKYAPSKYADYQTPLIYLSFLIFSISYLPFQNVESRYLLGFQLAGWLENI